jgi:fructoselysine-6-P-deglycase FrlB-like protein
MKRRMGKPYERELAELPNTYAWAMEAPIAKLAEALSECSALPLIAIGSGGSLTAAEFACHMHQRHLE